MMCNTEECRSCSLGTRAEGRTIKAEKESYSIGGHILFKFRVAQALEPDARGMIFGKAFANTIVLSSLKMMYQYRPCEQVMAVNFVGHFSRQTELFMILEPHNVEIAAALLQSEEETLDGMDSM